MNLKVSQKNPSFVLSFFLEEIGNFLHHMSLPYSNTVLPWILKLLAFLEHLTQPARWKRTRPWRSSEKKLNLSHLRIYVRLKADASLLAQNSWTLKRWMLRTKMELLILSRIIDERTETFAKIEKLCQP